MHARTYTHWYWVSALLFVAFLSQFVLSCYAPQRALIEVVLVAFRPPAAS